MKNYFISLLCLFVTNTFFAQSPDNTKYSYWYKANNFLSEEPNEHLFAKITTDSKGVHRAQYFDVNTGKKLGTIRYRIVHPEKGGLTLIDSSFVATNPFKQERVEGNAATQVFNFYNTKTNKKTHCIQFLKQNSDTLVRFTNFYSNGQPHNSMVVTWLRNWGHYIALFGTPTTYNEYLSKDFLDQKYKANDIALDYTAAETGQRSMTIQYFQKNDAPLSESGFYPNGKPYWQAQIDSINYRSGRTDFYPKIAYKNFEIWDSTGPALDANLYFNIKTLQPKGVWLDFDTNGKLNFVADFEKYKNKMYQTKVRSAANVQGFYDTKWQILDSIDTRVLYSHDYLYNTNSFYEKTSFLSNITSYQYKKDSTGIVENTPIFKIKRDKNENLLTFSSNLMNIKYDVKTCPKPPEVVLDGKYVDNVPDGEWFVWQWNEGKTAKTLYARMTFKNGILDKLLEVWHKDNEVGGYHLQAKAEFDDGRIVDDFFKNEYLKQANRHQYFIDSLKKVRTIQQARWLPNAKAQHDLFRRGATKVWQQDTLITYSIVNKEQSAMIAPENWLLQRIINIKQTLDSTADASVLIRSYDSDGRAMLHIQYNQKTLALQDKAVVFDYKNDGNYGNLVMKFQYDITNKKLNKALHPIRKVNDLMASDGGFEFDSFYTNREMTEILQDSILIKTVYNDVGRIEKKVIDTFTLRGVADTTLPKPLDCSITMLQWLVKNMDRIIWETQTMDMMYKAPISFDVLRYGLSRTIDCFYAPDGKRYKCQNDSVFYQYNTDGKTIDKTAKRLKNGNFSGEIHSFYDENPEIRRYNAAGELHGWCTFYTNLPYLNLGFFVKKEALYRKGKAIYIKYSYNKEGETKVMAESKFNSTDSSTYTLSYFLRKNQFRQKQYSNFMEEYTVKCEVLLSYKNDILSDYEGFWYKNDTIKTLYIKGKLEADSLYYFKTWYDDGKPELASAATISANRIIELATQIPNLGSEAREKMQGGLLKIIHYYPNGLLCAQGGAGHNAYNITINALNIMAVYYHNGTIKQEYLNYSTNYAYPEPTNNNSCAWDALPYQEGKYFNNYRVGRWRGYQRNIKRQILYEINYDKDGFLDGKSTLYDTLGKVTYKGNFKNGKRNGVFTATSNGLVYKSKFENDKMIYCFTINEKGKIINKIYFTTPTIYKEMSLDMKTGKYHTFFVKDGVYQPG
jgi:hypothetical protein